MELKVTIPILDGSSLESQSEMFKTWFDENIREKIDFSVSCTSRDEWNRPKEWVFPDVRVVATYFTNNENYNFKDFLIYGVI